VKRLILFAHFNPDGRVEPFVHAHLRALRELGGTLHFISNSPLPEAELERLRTVADAILERENTGVDFGMWKAALGRVDLADYDELLLTNSSVIGPVTPLAPLFQRMAGDPCDFWGLTESGEVIRHIQTYFLVFRAAVLRSPAFRQFFDSVLEYRSKNHMILSCEVCFTTWLQEHGFTSAVAFPLEPRDNGLLWNLLYRRRLRRNIRLKKNPTLYYPEMLMRAGMPYGKANAAQLVGPGLRRRWLLALYREAGVILPRP
jgi:rhamnosyltransferase